MLRCYLSNIPCAMTSLNTYRVCHDLSLYLSLYLPHFCTMAPLTVNFLKADVSLNLHIHTHSDSLASPSHCLGPLQRGHFLHLPPLPLPPSDVDWLPLLWVPLCAALLPFPNLLYGLVQVELSVLKRIVICPKYEKPSF